MRLWVLLQHGLLGTSCNWNAHGLYLHYGPCLLWCISYSLILSSFLLSVYCGLLSSLDPSLPCLCPLHSLWEARYIKSKKGNTHQSREAIQRTYNLTSKTSKSKHALLSQLPQWTLSLCPYPHISQKSAHSRRSSLLPFLQPWKCYLSF